LFKSKFAANLPDFRKLQFAKALISLKLKFGQLGFNHNLIRSLTFSHSLDPERPFEEYNIILSPRKNCRMGLSDRYEVLVFYLRADAQSVSMELMPYVSLADR
jgi:hypothetical protein